MAAGHKEPLMVSVAGEERVASAGPRGVKMINKYFNSDTKKLNVISDHQHTETAGNQLIQQLHSLDIGKQTCKQHTHTHRDTWTPNGHRDTKGTHRHIDTKRTQGHQTDTYTPKGHRDT